MTTKVQLNITPEKREAILLYFSQVNLHAICRSVGVERRYVLSVLNGSARDVTKYPLVANVIKIAKEQYETKAKAFEVMNSI